MSLFKQGNIKSSVINLKIKLVFLGLFLGLVVLWIRAFYIQFIWRQDLLHRSRSQYWKKELAYGKRGEIFSADNMLLAKSIVFKSVFAVPAKIETPKGASLKLARILNTSKNYMLRKLKAKRKFVWIKRKISDKEAEKIASLKIKGIYLTEERGRIYPQQIMAGQLIGFVGLDNKGLEGLEKSFDKVLSGKKEYFLVQRDGRGRTLYAPGQLDKGISGEDVVLTIDSRIQSIAEKAIANGVIKNKGKYGVALVVDVPTGNILAWAQYPFFNPNKFRSSSPSIWRNRIALDMFEPGSTMKPFTIASAIEEGVCDLNKIYYCEKGKWRFKDVVIRDTHPHGWLPVSKIIRYSSNIGAAKIGLELGPSRLFHFLKELGFGQPTHLPLPGEAKGLIRDVSNWTEVDLASISFGQGISVTPLQLVRAYLCIANHGLFVPLHLLPGTRDSSIKRIISKTTCDKILLALRDVVEKDGTATMARIPGLQVGGKTGTSQKVENGKYSKNRYVASFIGIVPALNPRYLAFALIDEPKRSIYGGIVAAPVVKEIFKELIPLDLFRDKIEQESISVPENKAITVKINNHIPINQRNKKQNFTKIPDFRGKCLREVFAILSRKQLIPIVKGIGPVVVKQYPAPGSSWKHKKIVLWMGFCDGSDKVQ